MSLVAPSSAWAGTLTSANFTTSGTGYAATGAQNTRYDWNYTTATAATLSSVALSVPSGTNTAGQRYLAKPGTANNYAWTPDSVANSITGDIDLRAQVQMSSWSSASNAVIFVSKRSSSASYQLRMETSGYLGFAYSSDGSTINYVLGGATNFTANSKHWVRVTFRPDNGSGSKVTTFYTSTDGTNWSIFYSAQVSAGITSIFDGTAPVVVGDANVTNDVSKIYFASVASGINGTTSSTTTCTSTGVVACFKPSDPSQAQAAAGTWTSSSPQNEIWTVNRSGTNLPADIASDLTVNSVTGLPSGGTASYRMIDGTAVYILPTATVIGAATPCSLGLTGFTNTATAGSYASTITTYDNSATPVSVDSATTGTLTFTAASNGTTVSATIDPIFTFTIANQASTCNGESNFVSGGGSASGVSLGHVASSANVSAGQALTVASNAGSGFSVYVRGTQTSQNLRSGNYNWTDVTGTYASPAALGSGERFGYTYKDSTSSTSVTNPAVATFAALTGTNQAVMGSASSPSGSSCVSYDAQTAATTPAGSYSATIIYVAIPSY